MQITFKSQQELPNLLNEVELLTYAAELLYKNTEIDKVNNTVKLYFQRRKIIGFRRSFFAEHYNPAYATDEKINCTLTLNRVISVEINNNFEEDEEDIEQFTLSFGVVIKNDHVYIQSYAEAEGIPCYTITVKIEYPDFEFRDTTE